MSSTGACGEMGVFTRCSRALQRCPMGKPIFILQPHCMGRDSHLWYRILSMYNYNCTSCTHRGVCGTCSSPLDVLKECSNANTIRLCRHITHLPCSATRCSAGAVASYTHWARGNLFAAVQGIHPKGDPASSIFAEPIPLSPPLDIKAEIRMIVSQAAMQAWLLRYNTHVEHSVSEENMHQIMLSVNKAEFFTYTR